MPTTDAKDRERLVIVEERSKAIERDVAEIKLCLKDIHNDVVHLPAKVSESVEKKYVSRKELGAVSAVLSAFSVIVAIVASMAKFLTFKP